MLSEKLLDNGRKFPAKTAYIDSKGSINWGKLVKLAKERAPKYKEAEGWIFPLSGEKSISLLVEMFATLLSGNGYCVLNEAFPERRLETIKKLLRERNKTCKRQSIATVTSGTTGEPKVVEAGVFSIETYIKGLCEVLGFNEETVTANQSPFYFDACFKDVLASIYIGGGCFLVDKALFLNPPALFSKMAEVGVNTITWTSSAYSLLADLTDLDEINENEDIRHFCEGVKVVTFGSERMSLRVLYWILKVFPYARIFQLYGPTEAIGMSTVYEISRSERYEDTIPVGKPFGGAKIFIRNGEIFIGGSRLSEGYIGNEKLTKKAFPVIENERYFATGDLGHFSLSGDLVFEGRKDDRVKRGGYQISLSGLAGEAEKCEGVTAAVVTFDEERQTLKLYFVGTAGVQVLKAFLLKTIPLQAVPGVIKKLESFPRLSNGKIDKGKL